MPPIQKMSALVLAHLIVLGAIPTAILFQVPGQTILHIAAAQLLNANFWPAQFLQHILGHHVTLTDSLLGLPTSAGIAASLIIWLLFYLTIILALRKISRHACQAPTVR